MSRHRNVRSLNYAEECERDDDIYGHSYDEHDYGMSPGTAAQYLYDRSKPAPVYSFGSPHGDVSNRIEEEEEDEFDDESDGEAAVTGGHAELHNSSSQTSLIRQKLSADDNAKLNSCLEQMRSILGDNFAEATMMTVSIESSFNVEQAIDQLLSHSSASQAPKSQRQPRERRRQAQQTPVSEPVTDDSQDAAAMSDGLFDKSRPLFRVGDDEVSDSQLTSAAETVIQDVIKADVQPSQAVSEPTDPGDAVKLSTPKCQQLDSAANVTTPPMHKSASKAKFERLDIQKEYDKRQATGKDNINLVVIGHVDAGKSTLMGHLLYQLGVVGKKAMHKFEQDSRKAGKGSFAYAWVLDETEEERCRGVTMDIAQMRFEMLSKMITLLDAPGHKDFIPNMITGAAQADVAVLVVNATNGEFETGFDAGGQTREHTMLARSLGVSQLLVAVNKMDTVDWSKHRYNEIVRKMSTFLRQAGFKDSDVSFVPCSGLVGDNLAHSPPANHKLATWFSGPTLATQIDAFRPPLRPVIDKPLRLCVTDVFKAMGAGVAVAGMIHTGSVQVGDRVIAVPAGETAVVKGINIEELSVQIAFAGDNTVLTLTGIDPTNLSIGCVLCDLSNPVQTATRFLARIVIFNINFPITKGFPVVLHYQSLTEQAHIRHLISQLHRNTGEVLKRKPRCLAKNTSAVVEIEVDRPICLELYANCKDLGRFMLRSSGSTIAAGLVTEIIGNRSQVDSSTS